MNNNFSLSFSQPLSVDSDMPKSRNTITSSPRFSLMTQHDALLLCEWLLQWWRCGMP